MKIKVKTLEYLYCILYFIWGLFTQINLTVNIKNFNFSGISFYLNVAIIMGLAVLYVLNFSIQPNYEVSVKNFFLFILFLICLVYTFKNIYGLPFLTGYIFLLVGKNFDFKLVIKTFLCFSILVFIGTILLSHFNIISTQLSYGARYRNSLGFAFVSFPAQIFFFITCSYLVVRNYNIKYFELIILGLINILLYRITQTRDPFYLSIILLGYLTLSKITGYKLRLYKIKIFSFIEEYIYLIIPCILGMLLFICPKNIFYILNDILSNRLVLSQNAIETYGIRPFGTSIHFLTSYNWLGQITGQYNFIDSAYVQLLVGNGYVFTFLLLYFLTVINKRVRQNNDIFLLGVLCVIAIHGMFDPQFILPWYSPFILIAGKYFMTETKEKKESLI